jgi:hypothetical protein
MDRLLSSSSPPSLKPFTFLNRFQYATTTTFNLSPSTRSFFTRANSISCNHQNPSPLSSSSSSSIHPNHFPILLSSSDGSVSQSNSLTQIATGVFQKPKVLFIVFSSHQSQFFTCYSCFKLMFHEEDPFYY